MTLEEAIKRNKKSVNSYTYVDKEEPIAIQLGIEALERQKGLREMAYLYTQLKFSNIPDIMKKIKSLLPSETE